MLYSYWAHGRYQVNEDVVLSLKDLVVPSSPSAIAHMVSAKRSFSSVPNTWIVVLNVSREM